MSAVERELEEGVKLGYRPELDGLRAFAVLAVIATHYWESQAPGGFLGVDLFFVLSGFLITRLLLEEVQRARRLDLRRFYVRRAARLFPAVCLVCVLIAFDALTFHLLGTPWQSLKSIVAAVLYATNWVRIFSHIAPDVSHLWSLAVEEQFYLVWPVILLVAHRRAGVRGVRCISILVFVAASCEMALRSLAGVSGFPTLYYSTDAHPMVMLMAGCFLATTACTVAGTQAIALRMATNFVAPAAVALMLFLVLTDSEGRSWQYRGGFPVIAAGLALVVNRALISDWVTAVLRVRPLVWVGRLSYGIYLFHLPIYAIVGKEVHGQRHSVVALLSVVFTMAVSTVSYYVVERPIRRAVTSRVAQPRPRTTSIA